MVGAGLLAAACTFAGTSEPTSEELVTGDAADGDGAQTTAVQADAAIDAGTETGSGEPVVYEAVVVETYPHDPAAYTQGLEFVDGLLLESTGLVGESTIRLVDPDSGDVLASSPLADLYGEGATIVDDEIYQLTWQDQTLVVHSLDGLAEQRRLTYAGEGWGLCNDGERLIMSNGSSQLTFRDPADFERLNVVGVTDENGAVEKLNELECVGDRVWSNIFQSNRIVEIDPETGLVVGSIDLSALVPEELRGDNTNVLNGIAYNEETNRFWVTGKRWPVMYELELVPTS